MMCKAVTIHIEPDKMTRARTACGLCYDACMAFALRSTVLDSTHHA